MIFRLCASVVFSILLAFQPGQAWAMATDDEIVHIQPVLRDDLLFIDADVHFDVSDELRNAAERGVPLYFVAEVQITSPRWWWFDKTLAQKSQTWRVVYNVLTRQWRVGTGELSLSEPSLDDALSFVRNIRGWAVLPANKLEPGLRYEGRLRVRLDSSRLPRPFQIDNYNSKAWSLVTPWKNFTFSVSEDEAGAS